MNLAFDETFKQKLLQFFQHYSTVYLCFLIVWNFQRITLGFLVHKWRFTNIAFLLKSHNVKFKFNVTQTMEYIYIYIYIVYIIYIYIHIYSIYNIYKYIYIYIHIKIYIVPYRLSFLCKFLRGLYTNFDDYIQFTRLRRELLAFGQLCR